MIEEILTIVRSLQRAHQEEKDSAKSQNEAIQAGIRRALNLGTYRKEDILQVAFLA